MEQYCEYSMYWHAKKLYDMGIFTKDILKELCHRPNRLAQMYITKDEYARITGEEWTPLEV